MGGFASRAPVSKCKRNYRRNRNCVVGDAHARQLYSELEQRSRRRRLRAGCRHERKTGHGSSIHSGANSEGGSASPKTMTESIAEGARISGGKCRSVCKRVEDNAFPPDVILIPSVSSASGAAGSSDTEGKAARVAASEAGAERVSNPWLRGQSEKIVRILLEPWGANQIQARECAAG